MKQWFNVDMEPLKKAWTKPNKLRSFLPPKKTLYFSTCWHNDRIIIFPSLFCSDKMKVEPKKKKKPWSDMHNVFVLSMLTRKSLWPHTIDCEIWGADESGMQKWFRKLRDMTSSLDVRACNHWSADTSIQSQINAFLFQSDSWLRSPFPPPHHPPARRRSHTPPTCRSWISVKVITLTTQQRLMALQSDSVSRRRSCRFSTEEQELSRLQLYVSPRQGEKKRKEKRCSAASFLSFCRNIRKGRHDTSAYLGATPAVSCVCVFAHVCVCFFWVWERPDRGRNTDGS